MTKRFCDICEKPAIEHFDPAYYLPIEEWTSWKNPVNQTKEQCAIKVKAYFGFENHKTGFGGPPDLCLQCMLDLVEGLMIIIKKRMTPSEEQG